MLMNFSCFSVPFLQHLFSLFSFTFIVTLLFNAVSSFFIFVATSRSRICSSNVNKDLLNGLKNLAEQFRNDVSSLLLRKRYSRQQNEKRKEMLGATEKASQSAPKVISGLI